MITANTYIAFATCEVLNTSHILLKLLSSSPLKKIFFKFICICYKFLKQNVT